MPIEFRCTKCGKLLRTPDATAGKQARCPECATILQIPTATAPAVSAAPVAAPLAAPSANPYQAALETGRTALHDVEPSAELVPTRIDMGDVFSRGWRIVREKLLLCIGVFFAFGFLSWVVGMGTSLLTQSLTQAQGNTDLRPLFKFVSVILQTLFGAWIGAGHTNFYLKLARGKDAAIGDLFSGSQWFVSAFLANLAMMVCMWIGFVLLIVPGIIVGLMLSQNKFLIVDRNLGVGDALRTSRQITAGNKGTLFLIFFVGSLLGIVSAIPCGLGLLIWGPWFFATTAVAYLAMTGQPTAEQLR